MGQTCFCRKSHCQSISVSSGWGAGVLGASLPSAAKTELYQCTEADGSAGCNLTKQRLNETKTDSTSLRWEERGRGGDGGRRGRRCCFMLPDLQCHNREMLAYYKHCETKLRGFSNATLRLCWYEVFRLTCVHRYINSGSSLPCTVAVVVVIAAAAGAGLKQTNRCPSAHLPSPLSLSSPHDSKFFKRSPWVYIFTGCSAKLYSCLNGGL